MEGSDNRFLCCKCGSQFPTKFSCVRHESKCSTSSREGKKKDITWCQNCKKSFSSYMSRLAHEKKCVNKLAKPVSFKCQKCDQGFDSSRALIEHENGENKVIAGPSGKGHCRKCGEKFLHLKRYIIIERKNTISQMWSYKRCSLTLGRTTVHRLRGLKLTKTPTAM